MLVVYANVYLYDGDRKIINNSYLIENLFREYWIIQVEPDFELWGEVQ